MVLVLTILSSLTLRGLILPISNTGISIAHILATVHFLYPKPGSFFDMEYYFYQLAYRDLKVPKHFVGLNQMQCSPSFDWNWDKENDPTACSHHLHPQFQVLQQGKCLRHPPANKCKVLCKKNTIYNNRIVKITNVLVNKVTRIII